MILDLFSVYISSPVAIVSGIPGLFRTAGFYFTKPCMVSNRSFTSIGFATCAFIPEARDF